jgi:hypothetical protein
MSLPETDQERVRRAFTPNPHFRYQEDPVGYARNVLGCDLTDDQEDILRSLVTNRRTAVKASHAIGKTFTAAVAACWWYDCWDAHIVYITAPTWGQALGLTFKQIKLLRRQNRLPGDILETGRIRDEDKDREPAHFIRALNAENGEGFQGEHAAPVLIILEEAIGVPHYIFEATDGLMTHPDCRVLAIANPTDESGDFGDACASSLYHALTVNGLHHPNITAELAGEEPLFPNAVRLAWILEMLEKECVPVGELAGDAFEFPEGTGSYWLPNAVFQGRVLGEFTSQADEQVVPRGWLVNLPVLEPSGKPEIGCDVARFGTDRTTIGARDGGCVLLLKEIRQMSLDAVTGAIIQVAQEIGKLYGLDPKKLPIRIDETGGLGAGPCDFLKAAGYAVEGVNSSQKAIDAETYPNKRSELWFVTRERARTRDLDLSRLSPEIRDRLVRELSTPKWKPDSQGRKVVEPKQDTKKRLGSSPDLADAVNLAFAVSKPRVVLRIRQFR